MIKITNRICFAFLALVLCAAPVVAKEKTEIEKNATRFLGGLEAYLAIGTVCQKYLGVEYYRKVRLSVKNDLIRGFGDKNEAVIMLNRFKKTIKEKNYKRSLYEQAKEEFSTYEKGGIFCKDLDYVAKNDIELIKAKLGLL